MKIESERQPWVSTFIVDKTKFAHFCDRIFKQLYLPQHLIANISIASHSWSDIALSALRLSYKLDMWASCWNCPQLILSRLEITGATIIGMKIYEEKLYSLQQYLFPCIPVITTLLKIFLVTCTLRFVRWLVGWLVGPFLLFLFVLFMLTDF